jgi:hypothetical protein
VATRSAVSGRRCVVLVLKHPHVSSSLGKEGSRTDVSGGRFRRRTAAAAAVSAAFLATAVAWADYGGPASTSRFTGWMKSCTSLGYTIDGVYDPHGASGTFDTDYLGRPSSPTVQVARHPGQTPTFDFQSQNLPVGVVIVQTGAGEEDDDDGDTDEPGRPRHVGGTIYTYSPAVLADTGLEARDAGGHSRKKIKHIVFCPGAEPTAVTTLSFTARATPAGVRLTWTTASQVATLGYNVYRQTAAGKAKLNHRLIPAGSFGGTYSLVARRLGGTVRYLLQEVGLSGSSSWVSILP